MAGLLARARGTVIGTEAPGLQRLGQKRHREHGGAARARDHKRPGAPPCEDDAHEKGDGAGRHVWHVRQMFRDPDDDRDFGISGDVDLDATQDEGEVVFCRYQVGFVEDLLESEHRA